MNGFPKLKPNKWDLLVVVMVLLLALTMGMRTWGQRNDTELTVVISVDGEERERIPLKDFPDQQVQYTNNGYTLYAARTVQETLGIQVTESDCPTQDCVRTGVIDRAGESIVCLPGRISIQLEGGSHHSSDVDVVVG